jgi:predicted RNA-binding protein with PUA-like domain
LSQKKYWIFKSEPDVFSIDDLKKVKKEAWNGVRNYQARNFMRDEMSPGDGVLFYHSSCPAPGVAGLATVASESYPDSTSWDKKSEYFDPKSPKDNPRWFLVDVAFEKKFKNHINLSELKKHPELSELMILRKGNRLSITPVSKQEFEFICSLG